MLAEGTEDFTEVSEQDLEDHANMFTSTNTSTILARFERAANSREVPPDEYRNY